MLSVAAAVLFWGAAWGQYVELGCDTIEVGIAVRDNPDRFDGMKFHRTDPKPFAERLMARHKSLGPLVGWGALALVIFTASAVQFMNLTRARQQTQQSLGGDSENRAEDGTVPGAPQG